MVYLVDKIKFFSCSSAIADIVNISYNWIGLISITVTIGFGYLFSLLFACQKGGDEVPAIDEKLLFQYSDKALSGCCNCFSSDVDSSYDVNVSFLEIMCVKFKLTLNTIQPLN